MLKLLPEPCVCQITPARLSFFTAVCVAATALFTA